MSSPPPPWESHPPVEDEGYYGADTDADADADTGPVYIVTPSDADVAPVDDVAGQGTADVDARDGDWPHSYHPPPVDDTDFEETRPVQWPPAHRPPAPEQDSFAGRFTAPLTIDPRTTPVRAERVRLGPVVAGVAGVLAVGLAAWLFWPSSDAGESSATASPTPTTTEQPVDTASQTKLLRLLPPGYPSSACKQVDPSKDALAQVDCTQNADADGPPSATYTLLRDKAALQAAFDAVTGGTAVVNCPGNIQSPGPWRRNATPQQVSGTLVCGLKENRPTLAWTDDIVLLLGVVRADAKGPTLDQLYSWWTSHS
jgi:serine/threonine kinase PknH